MSDEIETLRADLERVAEERDREREARRKLERDLSNERSRTYQECNYCGHRDEHEPDPESALAADHRARMHDETCEQHPWRKTEKELADALNALDREREAHAETRRRLEILSEELRRAVQAMQEADRQAERFAGERNAAEARLATSERQAEAMRYALALARRELSGATEHGGRRPWLGLALIDAALSPDAGRAFAEEHARVRDAASEAEDWLSHFAEEDDMGAQHLLAQLRAALDGKAVGS